MYRTRAAQREAETQFTNVDDFLRSLDMTVEIAPASSYSIPRIAQLTQKTNQWNMTTRRYTDAEIKSLADDPSSAVLSIAASDRFGDHGIIGVCIVGFSEEECRIDTLLLSCRVIGRGIETMLMAYVADMARARGMRTLSAEFIPTKKNAPAQGFYERVGLSKTGDTSYVAAITDELCPRPAHIRLVAAPAQGQADSRAEAATRDPDVPAAARETL
jgi:FkbH-like protein